MATGGTQTTGGFGGQNYNYIGNSGGFGFGGAASQSNGAGSNGGGNYGGGGGSGTYFKILKYIYLSSF